MEVTYEFANRPGAALLRELILHIADRCADDMSFGVVKLNKVLFFADFLSFAQFGEPITGVAYIRLPKGPAPARMTAIRQEMSAAGELTIRREDYYGREVHHPVALRRPRLDGFKARDIALVDQIIRDVRQLTATDVSELSHIPAWQIVQDRERIPYEAIFLSEEPVTEEDLMLTGDVVRAYGWQTA